MSPNRLASETSPYLLQHANNPVDWYPWGEEAFSLAREREMPVLLSVGYAACHWCHVMERESFEDDSTAAMMNDWFVCIKVDREERPDIDSIYMDAVQAMTGRGGWPMTVFLTPAGEPFYAGTYFPKDDRHGMPSFTRVLTVIAETWDNDREKVAGQASRVTDTLRAVPRSESVDPFSASDLDEALDMLRGTFDPEWGGFGGAPKFPPSMAIGFLLRMHLRGSDCLDMATFTLDRMAAGGMYDQLGGGFHRYSVDREWHVPHFEKMLYDNAQLARAYTRAWQVTRSDRYRRVAAETLDYLVREMRDDRGGFYSSQDADSEGVEGKYFVWSWDELAEEVGDTVARFFDASPNGNWEGTNVLRMPPKLREGIEEARMKLLQVRGRRVAPATDDKILTAWNGLAISAFAIAGRVFHERSYVDAAERAAAFVLSELRDSDGRLLRSWRGGKAGVPGFIDDHSAMADALLTLYEATGDTRWFVEARSIADDMLRLFTDPEGGGFFQVGSDSDALIVRSKEIYDNAVPSGNSLAAILLQRLALSTGEQRYEDAARSALQVVHDQALRFPHGFGEALSAIDMLLAPAREVAIVGDADAVEALTAEVWDRYLPNCALAYGTPGESPVPLMQGRTTLNGKAAAYVCERFVCRHPVTDPEDLAALLG